MTQQPWSWRDYAMGALVVVFMFPAMVVQELQKSDPVVGIAFFILIAIIIFLSV